jgi:glyoxylase-like metal-dependent hydrolase (beta-lactamase superfamily II)
VLKFDRGFDVTPGACVAISPMVRRIVCGNPGPFTFKGTSTFIVGAGKVAVIDPGPADADHLAAILAAVACETVTHIFVSHSHADHSPLAALLKRETGAAVFGFGKISGDDGGERLDAHIDFDFAPDQELGDGDTVSGAGWTLEALHTPGHMSNHMCFALKEEAALFSADHVMAWSTSIIAPPDGNMGQYMASLELLLERDEAIYHPGHGPSLPDPKSFVRGLIDHRRQREAAILAAITAGARDMGAVVDKVYGGLDPTLKPAAMLSAAAHVRHLEERGQLAFATTGAVPLHLSLK